MKQVTVKILRAHPYGRENRKPGQIRTINQSDLIAFESLGFVTSNVPVEKEPLPQTEIKEDEEKPKNQPVRRYRRRDMRAEENEQATDDHSETAESD